MTRALVIAACLLLLGANDTRSVLIGLIGRSKADVIARLGPPTDTQTTVNGERLTYERLDATRPYGNSGGNTRAGGPDDGPLGPRIASFRCDTTVVIRDGIVQAFDRQGNNCR